MKNLRLAFFISLVDRSQYRGHCRNRSSDTMVFGGTSVTNY